MQVGALVENVSVGDRVTAEGHIVDGMCLLCRTGNAHVCPHTKIIGVDRDGCFAEYIAMPATNVWHLDPDVSYEIGGIHDPMGNAFHTALTHTEIPGATVLVTGCGPIGCFAVGICKAAGASRIIASDVNPKRRELARQMGAHDAVHPDEAAAAVERATGATAPTSCSRCRASPPRSIRRSRSSASAAACRCSGSRRSRWRSNFASEIIFKGITIYGVVGRRMYDTWHQMTRFLRSGEFDPTPVITHRFPLEAFDEAIHVIKSGEAGKVVFEIA